MMKLASTNSSDQEDSKDNNRQYWEGIRSQLLELAKLKQETDQFKCPCENSKDCPFQDGEFHDSTSMHTSHPVRYPPRTSSSFSYHSLSCPDVSKSLRRQSSPAVCYGGFESILMENNNEDNFETNIDEEEPEIYSKSHQSFVRRGAPVRRKKNMTNRHSVLTASITMPNSFKHYGEFRANMQPKVN